MVNRKTVNIPTYSLSVTPLRGMAIKKLGHSQPMPDEHNIRLAHRDDHCMLVVLREGQLSGRIDFVDYHFLAPCLLLIFARQVHQLIPQTPLSGWVISFDEELLSESLHSILNREFCDQRGYCCPLVEPWSESIENLLTTLGQLVDRPLSTSHDAATALFSGLLFIIAGGFSQQEDPIKSTPNRSTLIKQQFLALLSLHYKEWKKPSQYADKLHITTAHLNDTVKRLTGLTATQAIQEQCMLEARRLLHYTNLDVQEIAYQIGCITPSHFTKLFKLVSAMTPAQYRQKITQSGI